jgi:hypothetical protein
MKNRKLLKDSIECLKNIRDELHDDIDSSTRNKLEKAIQNIESCTEGMTSNQLLIELGKALSYVPAIERIVKALSEL